MTPSFLPAEELARIRGEFPFYRHAECAYLDSAATSQRPARVLDTERSFLEGLNSSVHRGTSSATATATELYESARAKVAGFFGASRDEIVWTQNATDALNTLAFAIGDASLAAAGVPALGMPGSERFALAPGDEVLVTEAEHHANLIPWQRLCARTGAKLRFIKVDENGLWSLAAAREALNSKTRLFAFGHVSNVTGFLAPVREIVELAQTHNTLTVLDACQSAAHEKINLHELGVDFAVFSAHKFFGPNGVGVLYGKAELLQVLPPARTGGSAITRVSMDDVEFMPPPWRFEPGTGAVSQVVALGAAIDFLGSLDFSLVAAHENALILKLLEGVSRVPGVRIIGAGLNERRVSGAGSLASFTVAGVHAHDVGQFLDEAGVVVRVGHHCAAPLHTALRVTSSTRASVCCATDPGEVDAFVAAVTDAQKFFCGGGF